jgi:hypothetical protein
MKKISFLSALVAAATLATSASAITLQQGAKPRETPPSGYSGDVYVDSRGCAYARANVGQATNWVPRLTANRKEVVCGLTPTFAAGNARAPRPPAPIAPPEPAEMEVAAAPATPETAPRAPEREVTTRPRQAAFQTTSLFGDLPTPSPAPEPTNVSPGHNDVEEAEDGNRRMTVTCPATRGSARVKIGGTTVNVNCGTSATQPRVYRVQHEGGATTEIVASPAPVVMAQARQIPSYGDYRPAVTVVRVPRDPNRVVINHPTYEVPAASANGRYLTTAPRLTMEDANVQSTYRVPHAGESYQAYVADKARAMEEAGVPYNYGEELEAKPLPSPYENFHERHYHRAPRATTTEPYSNPPAGTPTATAVPEGYRPAWEDGRLNPHRGPRTIQGEVDQSLVWTNTVPRRLVSQ